MKKNLSLFALVTACAVLLAISVVFIFSSADEKVEAVSPPTDIGESFAEKEITFFVTLNVLGTENVDGKVLFCPGADVTREYFAKSIIKLIGADVSLYSSFELDIEDIGIISEEYLPYIRACVAGGIMDLYVIDGKKYFLPEASITREEAADSIGRLSGAVISTTKPDEFSDIKDTDEPYKKNFEKLINLDIIIGYPDNTVKPKNILTREEFAVILYRVFTSKTFVS